MYARGFYRGRGFGYPVAPRRDFTLLAEVAQGLPFAVPESAATANVIRISIMRVALEELELKGVS